MIKLIGCITTLIFVLGEEVAASRGGRGWGWGGGRVVSTKHPHLFFSLFSSPEPKAPGELIV